MVPMIKSMTGFGRAEAAEDGLRCVVEIASVNRKQADVDIRLPREWSVLEQDVRRLAAPAVSRGRVHISVSITQPEASHSSVKVDVHLAQAYISQLRGLIPGSELTTSALLRAPGVCTLVDASAPVDQVRPLLAAAVTRALAEWDAARVREGAHLLEDITSRLKTVAEIMENIRAAAPQVLTGYRAALLRRLEEAAIPLPLDDDRLLKEIAIFADRIDISEELSRLSGHLTEFARLLAADTPSGRNMDFLTQELNRELNTIGSKANNAAIAHQVVAGKTEVERIREQIQNAE